MDGTDGEALSFLLFFRSLQAAPGSSLLGGQHLGSKIWQQLIGEGHQRLPDRGCVQAFVVPSGVVAMAGVLLSN